MEEIQKTLISYYEYFYSKVNNDPEFVYYTTKRDYLILTKFLTFMKLEYQLSSLGDEFWFDFVSFQFSKRVDNNENGILLNHIFCKISIERWKKREKNYQYHLKKDFLEPYNIVKGNLIKNEDIDCSLKSLKEKEKKKLYNTVNGFLNCLEYTDLYNKESDVCLSCLFKLECEKILKRRIDGSKRVHPESI